VQVSPKPLQSVLRLKDGRTLTYAEHGDAHGWPVLACHGSPSSRLEQHVEDVSAYQDWGIRFICPDRPGFGGSDQHVGRRIIDWPRDAAELLDHLGVGSFSVVSLSGGVAYALACATRFPDRVSAVGVLGGLPPLRGAREWAAKDVIPPAALQGMLELVLGPLARRPTAIPRYLRLRVNGADRRTIDRPRVRSILTDMFQEGLRNGVAPLAVDRRLLLGPWGFPLSSVRQQVHIWHGTQDWIVPAPLAQVLAAGLRHPSKHWLDGEGHFLVFNHAKEIYASLNCAR
jgi:pimeloyl-ACP methyl ester carboxylesterase